MQTQLSSYVPVRNAASADPEPVLATGHGAEHDHELRAGLFAIEVAATGVRQNRDRMSSGQVDELMDALVTEIGRVRGLFERRLTSLTTFDLGEAIAPILCCARASGLDVRGSVPQGILVEGHCDHTAQVLVAVFDNVRQHAAGSPVEVRLVLHADTASLSISDRGPGIDSAVCERIFERGVRGTQSTGCGLGLHVARRLMEAQSGSIAVRTSSGEGAEFVLGFRRA
jgi:signal transduction histidine kinase